MNPKDLNENEKLLVLIDKMIKENRGTNFDQCFPQHCAVFLEYLEPARKKQIDCFPDRDTYQAFSSAKLFFDKFKYVVFQKNDETCIEDQDHNMPPLEAFHYTEEEIEMKKNRFLEGLNKGDILHLKVIEEERELYYLQILNKYGDNQRVIDYSLSAVIFKGNALIKKIKPPLRVGDLVRAIAFGNIKREGNEKLKKMIVSINSNAVADNKLKSLHLGRVYKKDIPYYPEDISNFKSFGEYLKANDKFQSSENIVKQIRSFGCDPLKTGPLYETRFKKQIPNDYDTLLSEATQKLQITCDKTQQATELLKKGELLNAFLKIQEALQSYPENDLALTIRGKIYLALAGGMPSRKVKKAFLDFEAALRINCYNVEASELRDAILMESWLKFNEKKMPEKAKRIQDHLGKRSLSEKTEEFLKSVKKRKATRKNENSLLDTGASSFCPIPVINLKEEELMDV